MNRLTAVIAFLVLVTILTIPVSASEGHNEEKVPGDIAELKNPIPMTTESIEKGLILYEKNCAGCHGERGRGDGPIGLDLPEKPTDFTDPEMMKDHSNGELFYKTKEGTGENMPAFRDELTDEEIWNVVNYIISIVSQTDTEEKPELFDKSETTSAPSPEEFLTLENPVLNDHASFTGGKEVYGLYCYRCHGENGQGNNGSYAQSVLTEPAPDLSDPALLRKMTDGELFFTIKFGSGEMPSYEEYLHDQEIWQTVNYIRTFEGKEHDTTEEDGSGTTLYLGILVALVLAAYFVKRRR